MNCKIIRNSVYRYLKSNPLLRRTIRSKVMVKLTKKHNYHRRDKAVFRSRLQIASMIDRNYMDPDVGELYVHYMRHEYNFLGTGWRNWSGEKTGGETADAGIYEKIWWKKDILTGYEYCQKYFHSGLIDRLPKGVDIKILWELGRMYHWPQLAVIAINDERKRNDILVEFVCQMNDFMEANPIGEGVQFYCPMEAAIRAINLLFTYDCLLQMDDTGILTENFKTKLEAYLFLHGEVIACNLEYNFTEDTCGNHYLADLCGLLWISMYFDGNERKNNRKCLMEEFVRTIQYQFLPGGSNFECSSGYHRLASELSALGVLAITTMDCVWQDQKLKRILKKMALILQSFRGIDGRMIQIGDNDSGSVLKLKCFYEGEKEDTLRVDSVYGLICRVIGEEKNETEIPSIINRFGDAYGLKKETAVLTEEEKLQIQKLSSDDKQYLKNISRRFMYHKRECRLLPEEINLKACIIDFNKEFGFIKISAGNMELFIRTIPDYSQMELAHAHDDVFHWEVVSDHSRIRPDLGSIAYTSNPKARMFFASARSHNVPVHKTPIIKRSGIFAAETSAKGETYFDEDQISLIVYTENYVHMRTFVWKGNCMDIFDDSDDEFLYHKRKNERYSLGYGQLYEG